MPIICKKKKRVIRTHKPPKKAIRLQKSIHQKEIKHILLKSNTQKKQKHKSKVTFKDEIDIGIYNIVVRDFKNAKNESTT